MSEPFLAEIRIFPFNFAPQGWAFCNGQILPISQNTALFSLIGTYYGGNGTSNFALPNLQGSAPMQPGQGAGLSPRVLGEVAGAETHTLIQSEMPAHAHALNAVVNPALLQSPSPTVALARARGGNIYQTGTTPNASLNPSTLAVVGGSQPHNNLMPYLTFNFCIALQGIFPPRG